MGSSPPPAVRSSWTGDDEDRSTNDGSLLSRLRPGGGARSVPDGPVPAWWAILVSIAVLAPGVPASLADAADPDPLPTGAAPDCNAPGNATEAAPNRSPQPGTSATSSDCEVPENATTLAEPTNATPETATGVGPNTSLHPYDADGDCVLSDTEVLDLVAAWGRGNVDDTTLLEGVAAWGKAPGRYC